MSDEDRARADGAANAVSSPHYGSFAYNQAAAQAAAFRQIQVDYDNQIKASHAPATQPGSYRNGPASTPARPGLPGTRSYVGSGSGASGGRAGGLLAIVVVFGSLIGAINLAINIDWKRLFPAPSHAAGAAPIKPLPAGSVPSVDVILAKTGVADPIESRARQAVALNEVIWALRHHSKGGEFGRLTRAEQATVGPYWQALGRVSEEGKELIRLRGAPPTGWHTPQGQWSDLLNRYRGIAWNFWPQLM